MPIQVLIETPPHEQNIMRDNYYTLYLIYFVRQIVAGYQILTIDMTGSTHDVQTTGITQVY